MKAAASASELIMSGLSAREREVLMGIYVEQLTTAQVAERLSISQERVAQIRARATRRLLTEAVPTAAAGRQLERMIETMLPQEVPSPAEAWHAQQNAQARSELLAEFGAFTAEEVAEQAGSTAANRSALASRWHSEGRIVGVPWQGHTLFPAFQFRDGRPDPTIRRAAALLRRRGLAGWALALWFVTPSGWLWDRRPVDLLAEDSELVLAAAGEALSLPA